MPLEASIVLSVLAAQAVLHHVKRQLKLAVGVLAIARVLQQMKAGKEHLQHPGDKFRGKARIDLTRAHGALRERMEQFIDAL